MSRYTLCFNINAGMKMIGSQFTEIAGEIHGNVYRRNEIILPESGLGPDRSTLAEYSQQYQRKTEEHGSIFINSSPPLIKGGLMFVISKPKYFKISVTILYL